MRVRWVGPHSAHFREPYIPAPKCKCGSVKRRGQLVCKSCFFCAPGKLRKEVYSKDEDVARAAVQALLDFAYTRSEEYRNGVNHKEHKELKEAR